MLMDRVLGYDLVPKVVCYLDDVVIATNDYNEHIDKLREVAARLKRTNLTINVTKFCVPRLAYLHGIHFRQRRYIRRQRQGEKHN